MLKLRHPFFNPPGRRAAVVAVCAAWGLVELLWGGAVFWAVVFLGLAAVCGWVFFVDWTDVPEDET